METRIQIHSKANSLQSKLNEWCMSRSISPCHKILLSLVVCWELWVHRNKGRFDGGRQHSCHIISVVESNIRNILHGSSIIKKRCSKDEQILQNFHCFAPSFKKRDFIIARWFPPRRGRLKLDVDGSARGNPGLERGGSILRDEKGKLIRAQGDAYGRASNMIAESRALLQGLQLCFDTGNKQLVIEVDSVILMWIIQRRVKVPWAIAYIIRSCVQLLQKMEYSIMHIFRKNNQAADFMANFGCDSDKHVVLFSGNIPRKLKGIVILDACGMYNIRTRKL